MTTPNLPFSYGPASPEDRSNWAIFDGDNFEIADVRSDYYHFDRQIEVPSTSSFPPTTSKSYAMRF